MIRRLFLLMLALGIGYSVGFEDARQNEQTIFARAVDRVRGEAHDRLVEQRDRIEQAAGEAWEEAAAKLQP